MQAAIYEFMDSAQPGTSYRHFDDLYPIVTTQVRPRRPGRGGKCLHAALDRNLSRACMVYNKLFRLEALLRC